MFGKINYKSRHCQADEKLSFGSEQKSHAINKEQNEIQIGVIYEEFCVRGCSTC